MTSDVIAAADWIIANKDRYNIRVANFSLHSAAADQLPLRPAQPGGRAALVQRRRRRCRSRQLRRERRAVRRPLRARQRPVRDHRRRRRHRRHGSAPPTTRRRRGRLTATRSTGSPSPTSRRPAATWSARFRPPRRSSPSGPSRSRAGLHAAVGHVVRGTGRLRHGRLPPGACTRTGRRTRSRAR